MIQTMDKEIRTPVVLEKQGVAKTVPKYQHDWFPIALLLISSRHQSHFGSYALQPSIENKKNYNQSDICKRLESKDSFF